jgi:hypothetical protein
MEVISAINLKVPSPSALWMQGLKTSLAGFVPAGSPLCAGVLDENWPGPQASHPIYSVGLSAIVNAPGLAAFDKIFCWRFLAGDVTPGVASGCWATAEVDGVPAKIIAAIRGPEAADVLNSATALNHLNVVSGQPANHYDVRVLRIPGLSLEAFWLRSTDAAATGGSASDWVIPYGLVTGGAAIIKLPGGQTLNKNQAYSESEFLAIAANSARRRLASVLVASSTRRGV